jgi:uncharacterized protein (TIGR02147 family)
LTDFLSPQEYLRQLYDITKKKSFGYSYLDFSADLGFSRTNISRLVIVGKRPLTVKSAERIVKSLELTGVDRRYFTILVRHGISRVPLEKEQLFRDLVALKTKKNPGELRSDHREYFNEWYHPVIREITGLQGYTGDPQWIQEKLNFALRLDQIKRSLELLASLGFIELDVTSGKWLRTDALIATEQEVDSLAIIRYHQKMIEMGRESLTQIDEDQRDVRAATLTVPVHLLPVLKAKVASWLFEMVELEKSSYSASPLPNSQVSKKSLVDDQVVQINVQLFAFTKPGLGSRGGKGS